MQKKNMRLCGERMEKKGKRIAIVDKTLCNPEKCAYICIKMCPMNRMGKECIVQGEDGKIRIEEELCSGCGICVKKCPFSAIKIVNLLGEKGILIHQYGKNAFRLYNLPLPKKGICGFVGKNGLGKSTAMKILIGKIKPNFGCLNGEGIEQAMESLPVQLKQYLSQLSEKSISHKVQNIEALRNFDVSVEQALKQMIEGDWRKMMSLFRLEHIKERKLKELSGGELQRVAIALAYGKNAEMYFFDEVTNYLDIEERLRIANIIKELGEQRDVIVVEHDLSILDYLSDYVYIFYGEENAYGCVSSVKQVRTGINEYLDGFLKEENIRFREEAIRFTQFAETESAKETFFSYPDFKKSYDGFMINVEEGDVRKGEVVGIVGKNALGKTTFVKVLAGVEQDDEGQSFSEGLTISYKPQYLNYDDGDVVVENLFNEGINKEVKERCFLKLDLTRIRKRKIKELSGGELQRVAIALALSKKADLYLLDEPTAFLDVEQRLNLCSLLHQVFTGTDKAAFVVDHDILFINAISSRIIMFSGEEGKRGKASKPMKKSEGMNAFLKMLDITMRVDKKTKRPRINKKGSVKDKEQRERGQYYEFG